MSFWFRIFKQYRAVAEHTAHGKGLLKSPNPCSRFWTTESCWQPEGVGGLQPFQYPAAGARSMLACRAKGCNASSTCMSYALISLPLIMRLATRTEKGFYNSLPKASAALDPVHVTLNTSRLRRPWGPKYGLTVPVSQWLQKNAQTSHPKQFALLGDAEEQICISQRKLGTGFDWTAKLAHIINLPSFPSLESKQK